MRKRSATEAPSRAAAACSALALCAAFAGGDADADETSLGTIEVTGSHIPRVDGETALPVQVIRREEIERSGAQTVEDLLELVTANAAPLVEAQYATGSALRPGFSGASLRGLGPRATLVLIDGRRLANYAIQPQVAGGVDLHAIPLEAVEQVEILKDGASAIYGSDAIGGVINFILRKNEQGITASALHGQAEAGGAAETRITGTAGVGDLAVDHYNLFVVTDYRRSSGLNAQDRPFSSTGYRPDLNLDRTTTDSFPANVQAGGKTLNPAAPDCPTHTLYLRGNCAYDPTGVNELLPPTEQASVLARAAWQVAPSLRLVTEALFDRSRVRSIISPAPIGSDVAPVGVTFVLPTTSPFYPHALGLTGNLGVRYVAVPLGPRVAESVADQSRVLVGAQGSFGPWSYDTALLFNESKATYRLRSGYVDARAASAAFRTGLVNPFGDSGPAGDALLASTEVSGVGRYANTISRSADFNATRELFDLPAGPVSLAVGAEARHDSLFNTTAAFVPDIIGATFNIGASGRRSTEAGYAELVIPVVRTVDAQLALREDHYSDFGSTINPKIALRWQPVQALLLRASYGRGFRAPALNELYTVQGDQGVTIQDPVRCPVTNATADCSDTVTFRVNGNPALKPEHSEQWSAGVVFSPDEHVSASVDFWRIRLTNTIGLLSNATILGNDAAYEGTNIVRGPVDPATPTLPGHIVMILEPNENLGISKRRGIDVESAWRSDPTPIGRFTARLEATYMQEARMQPATTDYVDLRGAYFGIPRWQHNASVGWDFGAWTVTLRDTMQSGFTDEKVGTDGVARHVGAYDIWRAQVAWSGIRDTKVTLGIDNLFDRPPPVSNQSDYFQTGYMPVIADPRGRFWSLRLAMRYR